MVIAVGYWKPLTSSTCKDMSPEVDKISNFLFLGSYCGACEERYIVKCLWRKVCKTVLYMDKGVWDQMKVWHLVPRKIGPKAQRECAIIPCGRCSAKCTMGAHQARTQFQSKDRENSIGRLGQSARDR